jgi:hypothetical protein
MRMELVTASRTIPNNRISAGSGIVAMESILTIRVGKNCPQMGSAISSSAVSVLTEVILIESTDLFLSNF